jgi:hypothetical protein
MKSDMHVWITTFFKSWSSLMCPALKVVLLPCSASVCEHCWSIEGWIHSNRRNRLGQKLVDRLVRTHTNLKLEQRLEMYEAGLVSWDIEMTVEEPVSDDDDGPPHRVSDSESEFESEHFSRIPQPFQIHSTRFIKKVGTQQELFLLRFFKKKSFF